MAVVFLTQRSHFMFPSFFVPLVLSGAGFVAVLWLIYLALRPHSLNFGWRQRRGLIGLSISSVAILFTYWQTLHLWGSLLLGLGIGLSVLHGYCCQVSPASKLVVSPSIRHKGQANIHLASPAQAFDKETYRELPMLLATLSELGVTTVTLTSPMFVKKGALRDMSHFNKALSHLIENLTVHPQPWTSNLVGLAALFLAKYAQKAKPLRHVDITTWYQVTLTLKSTRK